METDRSGESFLRRIGFKVSHVSGQVASLSKDHTPAPYAIATRSDHGALTRWDVFKFIRMDDRNSTSMPTKR